MLCRFDSRSRFSVFHFAHHLMSDILLFGVISVIVLGILYVRSFVFHCSAMLQAIDPYYVVVYFCIICKLTQVFFRFFFPFEKCMTRSSILRVVLSSFLRICKNRLIYTVNLYLFLFSFFFAL